ncbi:MAG: hypothetical protein SPE95_04785 [Oscillospiraceae bacterium]|nr:hypothetical protein [Bacteroidales bacterium]MDD6998148.1 hypothetical protein [Oscillospiraceae bacterium]MDY5095566.1 hypothetical protein [Oscillospiraceae bacterium]
MPDFDRLKKKCSPSLFFLAISLFFLLLLLIRQPVFSLARYFQNAGYQTAGLHLMDRSNYNRNTIYPLLASRPSGRWRIMTRWTPCADMPPTGTITRS